MVNDQNAPSITMVVGGGGGGAHLIHFPLGILGETIGFRILVGGWFRTLVVEDGSDQWWSMVAQNGGGWR